MGRFRTQSLFIEMKHPKYPAPFTLKDTDHNGAVSMRRKYLDIADPTEYSTAIALLGSWKHWEALTSCAWFADHIDSWRDELAKKFESDRFLEMRDVATAQKGTSQGVAATKWLADRYSQPPKPKAKVGRPKKIKDVISEDDQLLEEEAKRIGL